MVASQGRTRYDDLLDYTPAAAQASRTTRTLRSIQSCRIAPKEASTIDVFAIQRQLEGVCSDGRTRERARMTHTSAAAAHSKPIGRRTRR